MSIHSAEPWTYGNGIIAANGRIICAIGSPNRPIDEIDLANAQLISASPRMLTTLKFVRRNCPVGDIDVETLYTVTLKGSTILGVIGAIQKAEGRA